jgi:hypothetical protein
MRPVRAYWWQGVPNFGDRLVPHLLRRFAHLDVLHGEVAKSADRAPVAQIVSLGSVLEHIPLFWSGVVAGAGRLHEDSPARFSSVPSWRPTILGLRGPLTAKGIPGDYALGDPGLLAPELVTVETKKHHLGIVPHWSDDELARRPEFLKYDPVVIDPRGDPLEVVRAIGECRKIVSSSLHGIIVADAFGIPRRFEYTPRFDREGGVFKFRDYSQSISTPFEAGVTIEARRFHVEDRQHEVFDMLAELGRMFA